ncbi:MAG: 4-(cytidine 5'-diphospho)-2-C-methyl-D-erythritol kinase [Armatimonadota bacterium]|nr:MAG: 4-(cytidine 5'-diphospho)-2-C-methyl-D-erythritol kinase [Armatimonadota bacterium]
MPPSAFPLRLRAPAKVNLLLAVLGELPDGYHKVENVLQAVSLWDELVLQPAQGISIACNDASVPVGEDNLCHRAARLLGARVPRAARAGGVAITLRKQVPSQAGLGGGSSDAAATLVGLNRLWDLRLRRDDLCELAVELGADVPFFIRGGTALGTGRGDKLTRLPPGPRLHIVLARSGEGVSTAWAYSHCQVSGEDGASRQMLRALSAGDGGGIAAALRNDLEDAVLPHRRDIARLKQHLLERGALGARMSGSGSAVFGIFDSRKAAQDTAAAMSNPKVWARAVSSIRGGVAFSRDALPRASR